MGKEISRRKYKTKGENTKHKRLRRHTLKARHAEGRCHCFPNHAPVFIGSGRQQVGQSLVATGLGTHTEGTHISKSMQKAGATTPLPLSQYATQAFETAFNDTFYSGGLSPGVYSRMLCQTANLL